MSDRACFSWCYHWANKRQRATCHGPAKPYSATRPHTIFATSLSLSAGSEESAGVHNVLFDDILVNCTTDPMRCKHGLYIKAARGRGGVVSNITVNNTVTAGIYTYFGGITLDYTRPQPPPTNVTATPYVHNVTFSNSVATGGGGMAFDFAGLPESVLTGIRIVNVTAHQGVANGGCVNATGTCEGTNVCPKCFQPAD